jgi:cysteine-rich repeat protein
MPARPLGHTATSADAHLQAQLEDFKMRTALGFAAALVVGGGAVAAGATGLTVPSKWYGSDTLQVITWDVLGGNTGITAGDTNLASGQSVQYLAGGSGAGQAAMAGSAAASAAPQQTAPMSKMMTNGICGTSSASIFGTSNGTSAQNASGIVIGMDAVSVYSSVTSGTASSCSTPSGNTPTTDGLVANGSSTTVFSGGVTGQNWKWALALLYGGLDLSNPTNVADCNSAARRALVASWSSLFQNGCANGNTVCSDTKHKSVTTSGVAPLWHAFRRDDASGTSDVFSSLLGLQVSGLSPSASGLNGFGASPYCNAMNWDTSGNNASCANTGGTAGHDQFTGPGGIPDPASVCTYTAIKGGTTTCGTATGTGTATAPNHRRPPPGAYGDVPSGAFATEALPTSFQDNDPIRRPCLGATVNNQSASAEEVCNTDNNLGLVLTIPGTDFVPQLTFNGSNLQQYPTTACFGSTGGPFGTAKPPQIFTCAPSSKGTHGGECPNSDQEIGGLCEVPTSTTSGSACLNNGTNRATIHVRASAASADGRAHNLHMYDGDTTSQISYITDTIQNGTATPLTINLVGGMGRIHSVSTIWDTTASSFPPNIGCQMKDATDQIACLGQADPCSVGYAGDGGKTWYTRGTGDGNTAALCSALSAHGDTTLPQGCSSSDALPSDSIRIDGDYPTALNVQALGNPNTTEYQVSRKLYFNSAVGFANVTSAGADSSGAGELDFAAWESIASNTQPIIAAVGYFTLSSTQQPNGAETGGLTKPFCEDFNEHTICGDHPTNDNACARNGGTAFGVTGYPTTASAALGYTTALPGDPSATDTASTTSTVCGNGVREAYEECDDGATNGTTGDNCSTICRCAGATTYTQVGGTGPFGCH